MSAMRDARQALKSALSREKDCGNDKALERRTTNVLIRLLASGYEIKRTGECFNDSLFVSIVAFIIGLIIGMVLSI